MKFYNKLVLLRTYIKIFSLSICSLSSRDGIGTRRGYRQVVFVGKRVENGPQRGVTICRVVDRQLQSTTFVPNTRECS